MNLFNYIDEIPDFPIKGIKFKDISPLLENSNALLYAKNKFLNNIKSYKVDLVGGLDARGFLFSTLIADAIGIGSFMIRKQGKLQEFEDQVVNSNIEGVTKDLEVWFNELINEKQEFITESGDIENWEGSGKQHLLKYKKEALEFLQKQKRK